MTKLAWLNDEIHHFDVAHQARVLAIAERAYAEGGAAADAEYLKMAGDILGDAKELAGMKTPAEQPDEPPVSIEVGQVMPALPPTLEELPPDAEPEPTP